MQSNPSSSIQKALTLLELVIESEEAHRVTDLATLMGMHRGSVSRIATELVDLGWLIRYNDRYFPGPAVLRMSKNAANRSLITLAIPTLDSLVESTQMMANVQVLERNGSRIIDARRPDRYRMISLMLGDLMFLHRSAGLLALVGLLSPQEQEHYLSVSRQLGHPVEGIEELRRDLARTKESGFAFIRRRSEDIVASLSKAVISGNGSPFCALTVIGLDTEFTPEVKDKVKIELSKAVEDLETKLSNFKP